MGKAAWSAWFVGLMAVLLAASWSREGYADRPATYPVDNASGLSIVATAISEQAQQLTVLDPQLRVLSVYQVQRDTGEIVLKSVRNIRWDLQMMEFNAQSPLPREIRTLVEQR